MFTAGTALASMLCFGMAVSQCYAEPPKRPFTVADEIGLATYGFGEQQDPVRFSPDLRFFVVTAERGHLHLNCVEDSLRFYRTDDVRKFIGHPQSLHTLLPIWVVKRSAKEGPVIRSLRWLPDSSGVAFLEHGIHGEHIEIADVKRQVTEQLTSETQQVQLFDMVDRRHYIYSVRDAAEQNREKAERNFPSVVGTGRSLYELILPENAPTVLTASLPNTLWAVIAGKRFQVKEGRTPLIPGRVIALAPDGLSAVTIQSHRNIPALWETLYPPPTDSDPYRFHSGDSADEYVLLDLKHGSVRSLTRAPIVDGIWGIGLGDPKWSKDGTRILLPGTFIDSNLAAKDQPQQRPCVMVVDLRLKFATCVEALKGRADNGREGGPHRVKDVAFIGGDQHSVEIDFYGYPRVAVERVQFHQAADGSWKRLDHLVESNTELRIELTQAFNHPPLFIGHEGESASRVLWDPNPQLAQLELSEARLYTWTDQTGHTFRGLLFLPSGYKPGDRYPLVIQTHGFAESEFRPSGVLTTAFAARALAGAGMMVLQTGEGDTCPVMTPEEEVCATNVYRTAIDHLVSDGLVDENKIGMIGFSRTCLYVMYALIDDKLHIKAASVTDGVMASYLQYLVTVKLRYGSEGEWAKDVDAVIGAQPFGNGLQRWLERSPTFNLDKVKAPLLIVGEGRPSLLFMWEAYSGLRYLRKPVELTMLNTSEHVLTNPAVRMASQGQSVDWFRFWLKDEEDSGPAKAAEYARWHNLRKLQTEDGRDRTLNAQH